MRARRLRNHLAIPLAVVALAACGPAAGSPAAASPAGSGHPTPVVQLRSPGAPSTHASAAPSTAGGTLRIREFDVRRGTHPHDVYKLVLVTGG
ncbi:MAG: hypothetical protein ACJ767_01035 [Chloroflexota bacterium]